MQKSRTAKVISLILAIIMLVGIFPASVLADTGDKVNSYDEFITDLTCLEEYANEYVGEHPNEDTAALVINYVRSGVENIPQAHGLRSVARKTLRSLTSLHSRMKPTAHLPQSFAALISSSCRTVTRLNLRICSAQWIWHIIPETKNRRSRQLGGRYMRPCSAHHQCGNKRYG